jgi:8-amino-7-oxononanoate synthase
MGSILGQLARQLDDRRLANLYRQRRVVESAQGARVLVDGRELLCFCSNDYLGLANHPNVTESFIQAARLYGVGSGASHLVSGHSREHHLLEEEFAALTGRDKAVLFSSGYMANLGIINALVGRQDAVLEDRLDHASLIDAAMLSGAKFLRFQHNDSDSLRSQFAQTVEARRRLVAVDGVFSMDGDLAPLPELASIAAENDALLMVDDAHGFGVLGSRGLGCCDYFSLSQQEVPILMCTLGKALGTFGAIVAGPEILMETLLQFSRSYIYTTALPPAVAAAARTSLKLLEQEEWRRSQLASHIALFRKEAALLGLPLMVSETAIQPLLLGEETVALAWQNFLQEQGVWVSAIRPPTVPKGTARLRITLSAAHEVSDLEKLLDVLRLAHNTLSPGDA